MMSETAMRFAALCSRAAERRFLKKLVASKPADRQILRINGQLLDLSGKIVLQLETRTADGKALHENLEPENAEAIAAALCGFGQVNLLCDGAEAEYRRSKSGSETILGEKKFLSALDAYGKKSKSVRTIAPRRICSTAASRFSLSSASPTKTGVSTTKNNRNSAKSTVLPSTSRKFINICPPRAS